MTFRKEADAAQLTWKRTSPSLPEAARAAGRYTVNGPLTALCLPPEYSEHNLVPPARELALSRFEADDIMWHRGLNGGPTTHLCSSQVQCVNALAPFTADPEGIRRLFAATLPIAEVLPFRSDGRSGSDVVAFEWIGLEDYLGESPGATRLRGAHATSADAAIRYRNLAGETEIALIEWKYTERYSGGSLPGGEKSMAKRRSTYRSWWSDGGPIRTDLLSYEEIFAEPLYQLFRLQCLALEMEKQREFGAERVRLVLAAPGRNVRFWTAVSAALRYGFPDLSALWYAVQRHDDRFHVLDTATLAGEGGSGADEFRRRYAHLAWSIEAEPAVELGIDDDGVQANDVVDAVEAFQATVAATRDVMERILGPESVLARLQHDELTDADATALLRATAQLEAIADLALEVRVGELVTDELDAGSLGAPLEPNEGTTGRPAPRRGSSASLDADMDTSRLKGWAAQQAGDVFDHSDPVHGITSKLLRFRWNGGLAVGVGSDASASVRVHAVVDALAWYRSEATASGPIHVILGAGQGVAGGLPDEDVHAVGTVAARWVGEPPIRLWRLDGGGSLTELTLAPATFTSETPAKWAGLLHQVASKPIAGMAAQLAEEVRHPGFALYPKLSGMTSATPWQMRLDGLDIGRTGDDRTYLRLNLTPQSPPREPYLAWKAVVGRPEREFSADALTTLVELVDGLADLWAGDSPEAVLAHGSAEHALEAHALSERLVLRSSAGPLRTAVPFRNRMLGAAQFPTLWGDVTRPARFLDALMADRAGRPWAVELKDQNAGGGHGRYLRHGISQAILYRHYIRSVAALDDWFASRGLDREHCQAALAFPRAAAAATHQVERHRELARGFGVEVIDFARPGSPAS